MKMKTLTEATRSDANESGASGESLPAARRRALKKGWYAALTFGLISRQANARGRSSEAHDNKGDGREIDQDIRPQDFLEDGDPDDLLSFERALKKASVTGRRLVCDRRYSVARPIALGSNAHLVLNSGACISAAPGFIGDALIVVGRPDQMAENWSISGGGKIDCENRANYGVKVTWGRFSRVNGLDICGANLSGVVIGDPQARSKSYNIDIYSVACYYNDVRNAKGSAGFYFRYATDCYSSQCHSIGYRVGFHSDGSSISFSQCHGWVRPSNGAFECGFLIRGGNNTLSDCYADTPTNYSDAGIARCSGFHVEGPFATLIACTVFMNVDTFNGALATDGVVVAVSLAGGGRRTQVTGLRVLGGSDAHRYVAAVAGADESTEVLSITCANPKAFVERASTCDRLFAREIGTKFQGSVVFGNGLTCESVATFGGDVVIREGGRMMMSGEQGPVFLTGKGDPEGVQSASVGSIYSRVDGTEGAVLYIKERGAGVTGWVAK